MTNFELINLWERFPSLKTYLLIMKLSFILCFLGMLQVSASVYSQSKLTYSFENKSIKNVLEEIENTTELRFFYNEDYLDMGKRITIEGVDVDINDFLASLLETSDAGFRFLDNNLVVIVPIEAEQQQRNVSGKVTDAQTGEPLPGVNIVVKGTTTGTLSNADGSYFIDAERTATLVFSFIGYSSQEVAVGGRSIVDIALAAVVTGLDEVVVVGYSTQTRKSLTGAVSTVNATALSDGTSANVITRLQGKVSGVSIINSHVPGGGARINIRGLGTINNNDPLIVIDGVPTKSSTSQLNPNEIESITVLKDATSAAIYGARGANGVIIVTTKRGTAGKTKVSFTARYGLSSVTNTYDLLNTQEYGEMLWLQAKNQGKVPSNILYGSGAIPTIPDYSVPAGKMEGDPLADPAKYNHTPGSNFFNITRANKKGTDWYDAILQKAPMKEYNLGLSGGGEKGVHAFNIGYSTEEGIVKYTSFDRYSIRSNADLKLNNWLKVGESLGITYSMAKGNHSDNLDLIPISQAYRMQPIIPVYDIMGNFAGTKGTGTGSGDNPLAILTRDKDDFRKDLRGIGNAYSDIQIIKGLNFKSLFGFDYRTYNSRDIFRQNPEFQESQPTDKLNISSNYTIQWNWANTLNFTKVFAGTHTLNVLVGSEAISSTYFGMAASRSTYFSDDVDYMFLDAGEKDQANSGGSSKTMTASYFGRLNYDFKGRYLAELTFRRDGSSRFGANNRWGNFPAASVGWRISEEDFMAGLKDWINDLKIRGGYGVSGNDEIGDYNGFSTFSSYNGYSYYSITGSPTTATAGFYATRIGNPDAKWETTSTMNIGIDVAALNNTLTVTLDVWQRKTNDMLFRVAIPYVVGAAIAPSVNIGDMDNKGFDLNINYANKAMNGDLTYDLGLILSHYKNEVVKISGNEAEYISGRIQNDMFYTRATKGTSYPEFFGLIVDGYFQDAADAAAYPATYGTYNLPGHFKFRDVNDDGIINDDDRTYIGSPHPKFTTGLNMDIGYKAFNLSAFFYSSYGNKLANYVKRWIDYSAFTGNRSKDRLYRSWGSPYLASNADAILPLADESIISQYPSTAFLEDGSFLRLKTLQLSYTLPKNIIQKLKIENLQVYLQGTNLLTLTKYKGLDPEVNNSGINLGIDFGQWPTARQIVFGIKLDL